MTGPYGYETVGSYSTLINIALRQMTKSVYVTVQLGQIKIKISEVFIESYPSMIGLMSQNFDSRFLQLL